MVSQRKSLNRLKSAEETIPSQLGWKQTFKYDRYGNRTFDTASNNTTTLANGCPVAICNPTANPADNKLVGTNYDNAGNTKVDANGQTFIYDAENKQVQVNNSSGIVGQYYYDGDGKRIKKFVPSTSETTIFVYDASGKMVAEYSTVTASQTEAKISYTTNDHLGSPRITTDSLGKVVSRRDFLPFGEEIQRASYGTDSVRQKFTGYERDGETGLDFAQARMFGSGVGRFTSPDPLLSSGRVESPQSWNRFSYVLGNPLRYSDPLGLYEWGDGATDEYKKNFRSWRSDLEKARDGHKVGSKAYNKLDKILTRIGTEGDGNNVKIRFDTKDTKGGSIGSDEVAVTETTSRKREGDKVKAEYAITFNTNNKSDFNYGILAHEGQHVVQRSDFNDSLRNVGGKWTWDAKFD
jgi:RHS repeat-associated protein